MSAIIPLDRPPNHLQARKRVLDRLLLYLTDRAQDHARVLVGDVCRHCGRRRRTKPRGLCFPCYYTPGVRDRYPSTSKYGSRGIGNFCGNAKPCMPTDALQGTEAKIAVMVERAQLRQELFHPLDGRIADRDGCLMITAEHRAA